MLEVARILRRREIDLADEQRVAGGFAQRRQRLRDLGPVGGVDVVELGALTDERKREAPRRRRVVPQLRVLDDHVHRIHAEAVHASLEPEADDVLHRGHDLLVAPVEVRLLRVERVQVPAAAPLVSAPGRASERGFPVVRRAVDGRPDVPVRVLAEPRVLDRGVRGDEVEQQLQAAVVCFADEIVEVIHRPEDGIDRGVVRDVVAEVGERRGVDRRKPERVNAEEDEVVEALRDPAQVADPVAVRVLERAWVNLVDDRVLPPHRVARIRDPSPATRWAHRVRGARRSEAQPLAD